MNRPSSSKESSSTSVAGPSSTTTGTPSKDRRKKDQRQTRSGRKVADYNESTSEYSEEEEDEEGAGDYSIKTASSSVARGKRPISARYQQHNVKRNSEINEHDSCLTSEMSIDSEQEESHKHKLEFSIFTKKFLSYDKGKREHQKKLEQENKTTAREIEELRSKTKAIKSNDEKVVQECSELDSANTELVDSIEKIKYALIQLEREIGPTVRSSGVRLNDTDNMVAYIQDFQKRIVSGCLLQP
ncbi:17047_t:CDS:2 [Acaulospora morrowiae]|uniref:17047_t:CDS:1 n=1 Tax=Acaulospora morrowiae TaxID=94023 RepID=A0A9N9FPH7_9GLOM|nr:17047_t:CDS:2 [Acaulospora morrowiae]